MTLGSYETIGTIAASLIDGGWSPDDVDEMRSEYGLTHAEAQMIAETMREMMA